MEIYSKIFDRLEYYMSLTNLRHDILSANIANAETPNYKPFDLVFTDIFNGPETGETIPIKITNENHLKLTSLSSMPRLVVTYPLTIGQDGNWVDIDYQMAQLAENTLKYEIAAKLIAKKFSQLKLAINEGR